MEQFVEAALNYLEMLPGAIGVGIGFSLETVVSSFIAGGRIPTCS